MMLSVQSAFESNVTAIVNGAIITDVESNGRASRFKI
jgi:hypothetical protein